MNCVSSLRWALCPALALVAACGPSRRVSEPVHLSEARDSIVKWGTVDREQTQMLLDQIDSIGATIRRIRPDHPFNIDSARAALGRILDTTRLRNVTTMEYTFEMARQDARDALDHECDRADNRGDYDRLGHIWETRERIDNARDRPEVDRIMRDYNAGVDRPRSDRGDRPDPNNLQPAGTPRRP